MRALTTCLSSCLSYSIPLSHVHYPVLDIIHVNLTQLERPQDLLCLCWEVFDPVCSRDNVKWICTFDEHQYERINLRLLTDKTAVQSKTSPLSQTVGVYVMSLRVTTGNVHLLHRVDALQADWTVRRRHLVE